MRYSHSNKHIRDAIRYAESKGWTLQKQELEHTSGGHYGVRSAPARVVAFESCRRREILNDMPVTSTAWLTGALMVNKESR